MCLRVRASLSKCGILNGVATCTLSRELPIRAGHEVKFSSVIGVTPPNQLRRGFLNYVERERAHPYRTFLHYNSWYDLGYFNKFDQAGAVDRVNFFGRELNKNRRVTLDSYLFDDGWDDSKTCGFQLRFPNGFAPVDRCGCEVRRGTRRLDVTMGRLRQAA